MSRTVLVTGGAGYIGSHVCKALAAAGHQPICFDTLEKGHDWAVRWARSNLATSATRGVSTRCSAAIARVR